MDHELRPFIEAHLILVWNEVKIIRLKKRRLRRKSPPNVCRGLLRWPKQISFLKGVKGEFGALGNKHTCWLLSLSADMHVRASAVISFFFFFFFSEAYITRLAAFWSGRLQDNVDPETVNCNHNILQPVRMIVLQKNTVARPLLSLSFRLEIKKEM